MPHNEIEMLGNFLKIEYKPCETYFATFLYIYIYIYFTTR